MGDNEIELNSHEDIDDLVPIPRVSEKPLDSLDCISKTFDMTITDPLFDFDSEFTLNSDNPIFGIHKWGRVMRQKWRHQNDEVQRVENEAKTVKFYLSSFIRIPILNDWRSKAVLPNNNSNNIRIFLLSTIPSINIRSDEFTKLSTAGEAAVEEAALYPSPVLTSFTHVLEQESTSESELEELPEDG
ncbi:hypothetical protein Tco_1391292 [Tanacetum coccineum]